jgi:hypothetical protein
MLPSSIPTVEPSPYPIVTVSPTAFPTAYPTYEPTRQPTMPQCINVLANTTISLLNSQSSSSGTAVLPKCPIGYYGSDVVTFHNIYIASNSTTITLKAAADRAQCSGSRCLVIFQCRMVSASQNASQCSDFKFTCARYSNPSGGRFSLSVEHTYPDPDSICQTSVNIAVSRTCCLTPPSPMPTQMPTQTLS